MEGSGSRSGSIQIITDPDPGDTKVYGSGTTTLIFCESKWHISHLVRLSQPFTALKIIKKVEQSVLEEAILSLDMPTIDQLLGQRRYLWSQWQVSRSVCVINYLLFDWLH